MSAPAIVTDRLILRGWQESDRPAFARMNADPEVMEFFPEPLTRAESDSLVDRLEAMRASQGFCPWAAELRATGAFIGFVGLAPLPDDLPAAPAVEVGWRLAKHFWGRGLATEAGLASLQFGFTTLDLAEIVSMTSVVNVRSRRVMERLGMVHDVTDDFEHPRIREGQRLRPHVLYRLKRQGALLHATA